MTDRHAGYIVTLEDRMPTWDWQTVDWPAMVSEINKIRNTRYTLEQVRDPGWCARELTALGYSVGFNLLTLAYAQHLIPQHAFSRETFEPPKWTYHLWKSEISTRGPFLPSLQLCAATALLNALKADATSD